MIHNIVCPCHIYSIHFLNLKLVIFFMIFDSTIFTTTYTKYIAHNTDITDKI